MFCMQCEQADQGTGCTVQGVCGKTPEVSWQLDLLVHAAKGAAVWAHLARQADPSAVSTRVDNFVFNSLFESLTNVSFDPSQIASHLDNARGVLAEARRLFDASGASERPEAGSAAYLSLEGKSAAELEALARTGDASVLARVGRLGDDLGGVAEMALYGVKGAAAYYHHAVVLGGEDSKVTADLIACVAAASAVSPTLEDALALCLRVGEVNVRVMAALDSVHTSRFGVPSPHEVRKGPRAGKAILVSGHDLGDLRDILEATEGTGIQVYTHGEMLPAHGYPELRKYAHLAGNWGGAWQNQKFDFKAFPGPVVLTSNCIVRPLKSYARRVFTRRVVSMPGTRHLEDAGDWAAPLVECALAEPGFTEADAAGAAKYGTTWVGFGHGAVLSMAGDVIEAVDTGKVSSFAVIGGCDGTESERSYFTDLAKALPDDALILTVGCGAFRVTDIGRKDVLGIPGGTLRVGQCNDSYGAALIALGLADHYKCGINELPISVALSYLEQKAVAVLLSLLHLGVKDIYLGPTLPAFVSPAALSILVDKFNLHAVGDAQADCDAMMARIAANASK